MPCPTNPWPRPLRRVGGGHGASHKSFGLALIGLTAFVALFRYKVGIIPLIGACAAAGLAIALIRSWLG